MLMSERVLNQFNADQVKVSTKSMHITAPGRDNSLSACLHARRVFLGLRFHHSFEVSEVSLITTLSFYRGYEQTQGFFFALGSKFLCHTSLSFKDGGPLGEYGYRSHFMTWGTSRVFSDCKLETSRFFLTELLP